MLVEVEAENRILPLISEYPSWEWMLPMCSLVSGLKVLRSWSESSWSVSMKVIASDLYRLPEMILFVKGQSNTILKVLYI
jgi:hypothetical protein